MPRSPFGLTLLALATLPLAGCSGLLPRSEYERPEASVPETWREPATTGASVASQEQWWRDFNDPALSELVENALRTNNDLAAATLRLKRARLEAGLADTQSTPGVTGSANVNRSRNLRTGEDGNNAQLGVSASYEIDLWGKLASARDAARWEAEATEADRRSTALSLVGTVASAYWTLGYVNEQIASVEGSITLAERTLKLAETQHAAGAVDELDRVRAQQTLATRKALLHSLKQQQVEARNALAILFNRPPEAVQGEPQRLAVEAPPGVAPGIPASLLGRRPDLLAAENRLRKYLATVDKTRAGYYPTFSLTGSVDSASTHLSETVKNPTATLGAGVTLPFLRWNEVTLTIDKAQNEYEEAVVNFRQTLYSALRDVDNALAARVNDANRIRESESALALSRRAESLSESRYLAGATTLQPWLDAQESRREAERSLAELRLSRLKNAMALYQALGGTMNEQ